jgi:hypothetical protein
MKLIYSVPISIVGFTESDIDCLGLKSNGSHWVYHSKGFRILGYWLSPEVVLEIKMGNDELFVVLDRIDIRNSSFSVIQFVDMRLNLNFSDREGMTLITQEFELALKSSRGLKGIMMGGTRRLESYIEEICSSRIRRAVNRTLERLYVIRNGKHGVLIEGTGEREG